jgi:PBP1b-binding outer membrane lipoprotein LpoB
MKRYYILILLITVVLSSCNRPEGKDLSKGDPTNNAVVDTPSATPAQTPTSVGSSKDASGQQPPNDVTLVPNPTGTMPGNIPPSDANHSAPIGSVPILHSEQLAKFHPRLPDFLLSKVQVHDDQKEAQSIIIFKFRNDTTRTLRSTVMDANESAASKLIWEMSQMQAKKQETKVVDGESITSHYLQIGGMPAIKAYIPSKTVATLFVLVGDHRAIALRESHVKSADHLVEAAKTIDFKKFETLIRN